MMRLPPFMNPGQMPPFGFPQRPQLPMPFEGGMSGPMKGYNPIQVPGMKGTFNPQPFDGLGLGGMGPKRKPGMMGSMGLGAGLMHSQGNPFRGIY